MYLLKPVSNALKSFQSPSLLTAVSKSISKLMHLSFNIDNVISMKIVIQSRALLNNFASIIISIYGILFIFLFYLFFYEHIYRAHVTRRREINWNNNNFAGFVFFFIYELMTCNNRR